MPPIPNRRFTSALPLALLFGLLSSCTDRPVPTGPRFETPVTATIIDAPRGGDPDFFWLPPTVPTSPSRTGPFDATVLDQLVVEVCALTANDTCVAGPPLARFTSTSTPSRIGLEAALQLYSVSWQTSPSRVEPQLFYRVRVFKSGVELGLIDVDVVRTPQELGSVDRSRYVGVVKGTSLPLRFRIQKPSANTRVKVNEIESSGGIPDDWIEMYNTGPTAVSLAGYVIRDNDDTHTYTFPAGTTIAAGGFYVVENADLGFGLGSSDQVRFFAKDGVTLIDSYTWTAHAATTYGRCPDGTGAFQTTTNITKGTANDCSVVVVINEVESSGGVPGDWAELYNPSAVDAKVAGWVFKDNDDTHVYTLPAGSTVPAGGYLVLDEANLGFGLGGSDAARLFRPDGSLADSYTWTVAATTTYGRCPNGTGPFVTTAADTKGAANNCAVALADVRINEIESSGGTPGDWIELFNGGVNPADVSGFIVRDNDDTHTYTFPAGTVIAAGAYQVVDESDLGFGLGSSDAARLFDPTGVLLDSYVWTAHATTTYGRCPNGTGPFATTNSSTKGAANDCVGQPFFQPWPGDPDVQTVDNPNTFGGNLSGLTYEGSGSPTPGILWGARNGPGSIFRLVWNGTVWTPDAANGWSAGKGLTYPGGTGSPDSEGITFAAGGSAAGIYVATERDNNNNGVSRNSILRFDVTGSGTTLIATQEWNLTADLPPVGANLGIEAVTWIPDVFLVSQGFFDEATGQTYNPANYPNHGTGLFFVALEANGMIYGYALDHVGGGFTRVATIATGLAGVMGLEFDFDQGDLWGVCDDTCLGRSSVLEINPVTGKFAIGFQFERPALMPNINNEGFAITPYAECVGNRRPAFWADDSETGGHAIRRGTVSCTPF